MWHSTRIIISDDWGLDLMFFCEDVIDTLVDMGVVRPGATVKLNYLMILFCGEVPAGMRKCAFSAGMRSATWLT